MSAAQKWLAASTPLKTGTIAFCIACFIHIIWITITLARLEAGLYYVEIVEILSARADVMAVVVVLYFLVLLLDLLTAFLLFRISKTGRWWAILDGIDGAIGLYSAFSGRHVEFFGLNFSNYNDPVGILLNLIRVFGAVCILLAKDFSKQKADAEETGKNKTEALKKCPFCAEEIKQEAAVCRFCNADLAQYENEQKLQFAREKKKRELELRKKYKKLADIFNDPGIMEKAKELRRVYGKAVYISHLKSTAKELGLGDIDINENDIE